MSSSAPHDQKSAASVTSITISVVAMKATSPPSRPKPESMYWVKTARKRSMTPVPPMGSLAFWGCLVRWYVAGRAIAARRAWEHRNRRGLPRRRRDIQEPASVLCPGAQAVVVVSPSLTEKLAPFQLGAQRIILNSGGGRSGRGSRFRIAVSDLNRGRRDREDDESHGRHPRRGFWSDARHHWWNIVMVVG